MCVNDQTRLQLVKYMSLTAAPDDAEALSALRKAQQIAFYEGLNWKMLMEKVLPSNDEPVPPPKEDGKEREPDPDVLEKINLLEEYFPRLSDWEKDFFFTVSDLYGREHWLSKEQFFKLNQISKKCLLIREKLGVSK